MNEINQAWQVKTGVVWDELFKPFLRLTTMKKIGLLICLCCVGLRLAAQTADDFFDPAIHPVAVTVKDKIRLSYSEEVLVRSVRMKVASLGQIESVERRYLLERWFLVFRGRHAEDIEQSVIVALRLKPDEQGRYFAENFWQACSGASCGGCDWNHYDYSCFCQFDEPGQPGTPGFCNHTWSDDPLLMKVPLKE